MLNDKAVRGESWETRYLMGLREGYHYLSVTANTSDVCADLRRKVRVDHDRNRRPPLPFSLRHIKSDSFGTVDSVIEMWVMRMHVGWYYCGRHLFPRDFRRYS